MVFSLERYYQTDELNSRLVKVNLTIEPVVYFRKRGQFFTNEV